MDYLIEFYKSLDSINLLLFWGVIIVITLLVIFSIAMIRKNHELKRLIAEKQISKETTASDIPIKQAIDNEVKEPMSIIEETKAPEMVITETPKVAEAPVAPEPVIAPPIVEERNFVAEEHVINYNQRIMPEMPPAETPTPEPKKEIVIPERAYQRNVLREMSSNQTSPIGISRQQDNRELEYTKATDLNQTLNNTNLEREPVVPQRTLENTNSFNQLAQRTSSNQAYLTEVSNKLNEAMPDVNRTEYELRQEADAIISYEELMRKKDTIKTVDEEEAVISIEELYRQERNKLYGITDEEKDQKFIDELKNFRNDL